jgi:hypothetical protein
VGDQRFESRHHFAAAATAMRLMLKPSRIRR